jgi:hypothetical protein
MQLRYSVAPDDLVAFYRFYSREDPRGRRFYSVIWWWFLGCLVVLTTLAVLRDRSPYSVALWGILTLLWLLFGSRYLLLATFWFLGRRFKRSDLSSHTGDHRLAVEDAGIRISSLAMETLLDWSAVKRIEATDSHTFIYVSDVSALVIPHRSVSEGSLDGFSETVRARIARAPA